MSIFASVFTKEDFTNIPMSVSGSADLCSDFELKFEESDVASS